MQLSGSCSLSDYSTAYFGPQPFPQYGVRYEYVRIRNGNQDELLDYELPARRTHLILDQYDLRP